MTKSNVYNLTVAAVDDGSCCPGGATRAHASLANVIIGAFLTLCEFAEEEGDGMGRDRGRE